MSAAATRRLRTSDGTGRSVSAAAIRRLRTSDGTGRCERRCYPRFENFPRWNDYREKPPTPRRSVRARSPRSALCGAAAPAPPVVLPWTWRTDPLYGDDSCFRTIDTEIPTKELRDARTITPHKCLSRNGAPGDHPRSQRWWHVSFHEPVLYSYSTPRSDINGQLIIFAVKRGNK